MNMACQGNFISINIKAGEGDRPVIRLPDGYTYKKIQILVRANVGYLIPYMQIGERQTLNFPCIDSKSPCTIQPLISDTTKDAELKFLIEEFGQIPDPHYFDHAFKPISVTGDDGNKYNVIPSDQFK